MAWVDGVLQALLEEADLGPSKNTDHVLVMVWKFCFSLVSRQWGTFAYILNRYSVPSLLPHVTEVIVYDSLWCSHFRQDLMYPEVPLVLRKRVKCPSSYFLFSWVELGQKCWGKRSLAVHMGAVPFGNILILNRSPLSFIPVLMWMSSVPGKGDGYDASEPLVCGSCETSWY